MISSNSVKKNKIIEFLGIIFLVCILFFSVKVFFLVEKEIKNYSRSQEIRKVNDELDSLFKDFVYFSLVEDYRNTESFEKEISSEIKLKILQLELLMASQYPPLDLVYDIRKNWERLSQSANIEKLNLLYELELAHNLIEKNESDLMSTRLKVAGRKVVSISIYIFIFGILTFVMICFFKYFLKKEINYYQSLSEKYKKTSDSMTAFLALASHELRTPLNGIIGLAQILRNSFLPELETHYADNIFHSGKSLLKITNNILDYSKNTSSEVKLENVEFSLDTVLRQVIITFSTEAIEKKIDFKYSIADDVPLKVEGDSSRLLQVLYTLMGNAIASTMNGTIFLKISVISKNPSTGIHLYFSIKDSGAGYSEEEIQRLFLSFSEIQILGKINEIYPALSLALCGRIIKAMKGELEITSKVGQGAEFSFSASFSQYSKEMLKDVFLKKYRCFEEHFPIEAIFDKNNKPIVLIVDDDPANLLMVQAMLERLGATTIMASNGKEAINEFPRSKVNLVLMDCQMPVMDGYEATKIIRKYNVKVPILAMGASLNFDDKSKCLKSGMNGFITKPIEIDDLVCELKKFLNLESDSISIEDLDRLEKNKGSKGMNDFFQAFMDDLKVACESIDQLIKKNDLDSIHKISHEIRSSSQQAGARGLVHLLIELENSITIEKVIPLKKKIDLNLMNLKKNISEYLKCHQ